MGKGKSVSETLQTTCCGIILLEVIGCGIAKLAIGNIYRNDCSMQEEIPKNLMWSAIAPILCGGMFCTSGRKISGILGSLAYVIWLIVASNWVYSTFVTINKDTYVPCNLTNGILTPPGCTMATCNKTLLYFAFAMVTLDWIFLPVVLVLVCLVASNGPIG